jgi:hypothetical protein
MGILVRTRRTGRTLLPLVTCAGIRISGIVSLTHGRLLALLLVTLPAVGITPGVLPPSLLTIMAIGIPLLVLPLIPVAFPLWPMALPSTGVPLLMLPLPVLPLSRLTAPAVGIASGRLPPGPLTLPTEGMPLRLLPLPRLTLEAIGIATWRLKLRPLPLEHIGA